MSYQAFNPPPNVPAQMTLFAKLLTPSSAPGDAFGLLEQSAPENEYEIVGVYAMGNGTTGSVTGTLGNSLDPLELGGVFIGHLNAKTTAGCTAERDFSGSLSRLTLQWHGDAPGTSTCSPSPLDIPEFTMLRSDPSAPLPTPPGATTTSTTTTTSVVCSYTLGQTSATFPSSGGTGSAVVGTVAGCGWTAQSFASWIVNVAPASGAGPAAVQFTVQRNTGAARTGTIVIAGLTFNVTQEAAADLVPATPTPASCVFVNDNPAVNIVVANQGSGPAAASTAVATFVGGSPAQVSVPLIAAGGNASIQFPLPNECFSNTAETCVFTVAVDTADVVAETSEGNNTTKGTCGGSIPVRAGG